MKTMPADYRTAPGTRRAPGLGFRLWAALRMLRPKGWWGDGIESIVRRHFCKGHPRAILAPGAAARTVAAAPGTGDL